MSWVCVGGWEGAQLEQVTPSDWRDTPYSMTSVWTIKLDVYGMLLTKAAVARRLAGHQSAGGRWWLIIFASLVVFFSIFPLNLFNYLYLNPQVILTFGLLILPPICLERRKWATGWRLICWPGTTEQCCQLRSGVFFWFLFVCFLNTDFCVWVNTCFCIHLCNYLTINQQTLPPNCRTLY